MRGDVMTEAEAHVCESPGRRAEEGREGERERKRFKRYCAINKGRESILEGSFVLKCTSLGVYGGAQHKDLKGRELTKNLNFIRRDHGLIDEVDVPQGSRR